MLAEKLNAMCAVLIEEAERCGKTMMAEQTAKALLDFGGKRTYLYRIYEIVIRHIIEVIGSQSE